MIKNQSGELIRIFEASDEVEEANYVVKEIRNYNTKGKSCSDCVDFLLNQRTIAYF